MTVLFVRDCFHREIFMDPRTCSLQARWAVPVILVRRVERRHSANHLEENRKYIQQP